MPPALSTGRAERAAVHYIVLVLEPGQIFASRYRVLRHIAEGGMGAIFEAEHTATERRVALKLLFPHARSSSSKPRSRRA